MQLQGVDHAADGLGEPIPPTRHTEKSPGVILGPPNRSPDKRGVELPQVARLAEAGDVHVMDQVETDFGMQPLGQPEGPPLPEIVDEIVQARHALDEAFQRAQEDEAKIEPGHRTVVLEVEGNGPGELASFAEHPHIAGLGRLHRPMPSGPRLRPSSWPTGVGQLQHPGPPLGGTGWSCVRAFGDCRHEAFRLRAVLYGARCAWPKIAL